MRAHSVRTQIFGVQNLGAQNVRMPNAKRKLWGAKYRGANVWGTKYGSANVYNRYLSYTLTLKKKSKLDHIVQTNSF